MPEPIRANFPDTATRWALCCETSFKEEIERAQTLRTQEKEYRASLPTDPQEALDAASRKFGIDDPVPIDEAIALAAAIEALAHRDFNTEAEVITLATRLEAILRGIAARDLDIIDILDNPQRAQRREK